MTGPSRPVLVTAGATRNPIDQMRFVTANSTGRTGVAIAGALFAHHPVHLLGSTEAVLRAGNEIPASDLEEYGSTRDLMERMQCWVRANPQGIVVHSAAVGDYETDPFPGKVESGRSTFTVVFRPTPKIADFLKVWAPGLRLVTFKAASPGTSIDDLRTLARRQIDRTRSDLVFANVLGHLSTDVLLVEPASDRLFATRAEAIYALVEWVG
jgi:phosphopantothenoylcysteine synthetase/decarboxylase